MSTLIVEVCKIAKVIHHPDADRLDIVTVKGWESIVERGKYKEGDKVVYIPIDSVLPIELSDSLGVTKYLSKGRVKTAKLRGIYSQGLIADMGILPSGQYDTGFDVKDILKITKYEPPPEIKMGGDSITSPPEFSRYTDVENIKNFPDILKDGEDVVITEKIHGSSWRGCNINNEFYVGSHNTCKKQTEENLYWKAASIYPVDKILKPGQQLFGEVYGRGIQKLTYDKSGIDIAFFDLMVNNRYVCFEDFMNFCQVNNLPTVSILYTGPWSKDLIKLSEGKSTIATHIREGFVVKPTIERWDSKIGRVILKCINPSYLLKDFGDQH